MTNYLIDLELYKSIRDLNEETADFRDLTNSLKNNLSDLISNLELFNEENSNDDDDDDAEVNSLSDSYQNSIESVFRNLNVTFRIHDSGLEYQLLI